MKRFSTFIILFAFIAGCRPGPPEEVRVPDSGEAVANLLGRTIVLGELDPGPETVALIRKRSGPGRVAGEVKECRVSRLRELVLTALLEQYARKQGISAGEEEIAAFIARSRAGREERHEEVEEEKARLKEKLRARDIGREERTLAAERIAMLDRVLEGYSELKRHERASGEEFGETEESVARKAVTSWKVNQSLFRKYGGRVAFQRTGPEPIDAYREFLREHAREGSFRITHEEYASLFWQYFEDEKMHAFYPEATAVKIMSIPWWRAD